MSYTHLTTSSMPNLTLANIPLQAGFLGDYMWLATDANDMEMRDEEWVIGSGMVERRTIDRHVLL